MGDVIDLNKLTPWEKEVKLQSHRVRAAILADLDYLVTAISEDIVVFGVPTAGSLDALLHLTEEFDDAS